jgi:hypothetical protein
MTVVAVRMAPTGVDIIDTLLIAAVREAVREIREGREGTIYVELWYYPDEDEYGATRFSYAAQPSVACPADDETGPIIAAAYMVGASFYAEGEAWLWWVTGCADGVAELEKKFVRRVVAVWGEE